MKGTNALIIIAAILGLAVLTAAYLSSLETTGSFSTFERCEQQRDYLLAGRYVACTECSQDYSAGGVYYAAGCFLSGTRGEQCLAGGGVCSDVYCTSCDNYETCRESDSVYARTSVSIIYKVANWGDVCDKQVFRILCLDGDLDGREYSSTVSGLGSCVADEEVVVVPVEPEEPEVVVDPCDGVAPESCDGTTLLLSPAPSLDGASCVYEVSVVNSEDCGFVPGEVGSGVSDPVVKSDLDDEDLDRVDERGWLQKFWDWLKELFTI